MFNFIISSIVLACTPNYNGTGQDPMFLQCYHPMQSLQCICIDYDNGTQSACSCEELFSSEEE